MVQSKTLLALAALTLVPAHGLDLDVTSTDSIKSTASDIAKLLVSNYHGTEPGHVVGTLDAPYNWWESSAFFNTLIQYWHLTGDDQYNDLVSQGLLAQQGGNNDFMPANQSDSESNDIQESWALAAMSAAELQLPGQNSWAALAQNVFNDQVLRWDNATCGGGLRWQIYPYAVGYDYKNSGSNGEFFQLASRLARYTGNSTYSDWASKVFDWSTSVGLVDSKWRVFEGAHADQDCSDLNKVQFSWSAGLYISGAAHMYNVTSGDSKWKNALDGLLKQTLTSFFPDGVAVERACEPSETCTIDMFSFKALLAQALVDTLQVAPYTADSITPLLTSSAQAAARACDETKCATAWESTTTATSRIRSSAGGNVTDTQDTGVGQEISALSFVQGLLVKDAAAPATQKDGGGDAASASSGSGGSATQSGTPTSTSSGTRTETATGSASPTQNAGISLRAEDAGTALLAGLSGSMMWLIL